MPPVVVIPLVPLHSVVVIVYGKTQPYTRDRGLYATIISGHTVSASEPVNGETVRIMNRMRVHVIGVSPIGPIHHVTNELGCRLFTYSNARCDWDNQACGRQP